jgi:hypothetical protein
MVLSRRWAVFLILVGIWTWVIWPRFAVAIWDDPRAWSGGAPTSFLWIHAALIAVSLAAGTVVGALGGKAMRRRRTADATSENRQSIGS